MSETKRSSDGPRSGGSSRIEIQYDQRTALYASQFIINGADDELVLDCSSGVVLDGANGSAAMPIHTRLAMSWGAAQRLLTLLNQAIGSHQEKINSSFAGSTAGGAKFAKLPKIETPVNA